MLHKRHDAISLVLAQRIAAGLADHPGWIESAKENLDRWIEGNRNSPSLVANYQEWRAILERPAAEIIEVLLAITDEGQRLRQNSPFVGVLSAEEVLEIKRVMREP